MKILTIILIVIRLINKAKDAVNEYPSKNKTSFVLEVVAFGLWLSSLIWLINL